MVLIWNELAAGDAELCAVMVAFNSVLQIVLYAPLSLLYLQVRIHPTGIYFLPGGWVYISRYMLGDTALRYSSTPKAQNKCSHMPPLHAFGVYWGFGQSSFLAVLDQCW
jgi:hypothetical protein